MSKSSKPQINTPNGEAEILASEYALGVLTGKKRDKAHSRMASDPAFRQLVNQWQSHFAPMLDEVKEVVPPPQSWEKLESRLFGENASQSVKSHLFSSLAFWRNLSFISAALAASLVTLIILRPAWLLPTPANTTTLIATLNPGDANPVYQVQLNRQNKTISISSANFRDKKSRVRELWLIAENGTPKSLGLLAALSPSILVLAPSNFENFKPGATLAISLEPATGAPDGKPTGPIIASGKLQEI